MVVRRLRLRVATDCSGIPGNRDLFLNTVNWLAQQENLISIRPRDPEDRRVTLTARSRALIFWLSIFDHPRADPAGRRPDLVAEAIDARTARRSSSCSSSLFRSAGMRTTTRTKGPVDDAQKHDKVFTVDADKIDELEIKSESGDRTTLKRKGTDWQIVQPVAAPPDQAAVSGITSNLASLEIQRVIDENPSDLKNSAWPQPRVEVTFKSGGQEHKLQIGQKTPTGTDIYAKLAGRRRSS